MFHLKYVPAWAAAGTDLMANRGPNVTRCELNYRLLKARGLTLFRWWNDVVTRPTWVKLRADGVKSVGIQ